MGISEKPILGTDQTSQAFKVGLYGFFKAKNKHKTGIPVLSSTFAIACATRVESTMISQITNCGSNAMDSTFQT
jgi:hypothetical protein